MGQNRSTLSSHRWLTILHGLVILTLLAMPGLSHAHDEGPHKAQGTSLDSPHATVENTYIRTRADDDGQFVTGTTGGDPNISQDDNKRLLYGYPASIWSSFSSVRIVTSGITSDYSLEDRAPTQASSATGDAITTIWTINNVQIKQVLSLASNPYTGRTDTTKIAYTVTNEDGQTHDVGIRLMLDVMIGDNDGAPYFVPGSGNLTKEAAFQAPDIPVYWKAFESPTFDPASLKGQGILVGSEATMPDRFLIARWPSIDDTVWDYPIDPGRVVTGDSAVALYWNPVALAPGGSATFVTYYGLAGVGGGSTWIDAPAILTCEDLEFDATLWVANTSDTDFVGGNSTISLPAGLTLAAGETPTQAMGTVPAGGGARSVSWRVRADGTQTGMLSYSATTTFTSGSGPLTAEAAVDVPICEVTADLLYLYDHTGAQNLGTVEDWQREFMDWSNDSQSALVADPKGVFGKVAKVFVRGYGHGTETSWISASQNSMRGPISVPGSADVIAIPLATAKNGDVNETDSRAGIEIKVHHPANGQTVMTYAAHVLETELSADYIVAFADVSEFQGSTVELTITLRQPDTCAGSLCTEDVDLYIGDLWFESLPDICTTEADASHTLYDYYDDPTPTPDAGCGDPQPYYFLDVEDGPYNHYGAGENTYEITADLPAGAQPRQFKVYYGWKSHEFTFNSHALTETQVYAAFPKRDGGYVNIAEPSRWMPFNDNPAAVAPHLVVGTNTFRFNVYATQSWEERSFDLWSRFQVPYGAGPCPPPRTYTSDADFDEGVLVNVNHDAPHNDQLQLNEELTPFPFIWIALSGRGTVAKVNTQTGEILGEYRSAPEGRSRNPSRTTVDLNGNVWVGNRDESSGGKGSVVHIGLEENFQCVDRNGNGVIDTSTGLDDVKPWPNPGGVDNNGGVSSAEDECIIGYLRVNGTNVRTVAVDAHNDVWIGGYGNRVHDLVDGDTGAVLKTIYPTCGGYGGLVDGDGVLWSASGNQSSAKLLRYDPASDVATCIAMPYSYGLGIDGNGNIWNSQCSLNKVSKLGPDGTVIGQFASSGNCPTGLTVTFADDNVWMANRYSSSVTRLDNDGNVVATITVGSYPTGAAVDAAGKVWVTNYNSNNAMRLDPTTNAVDLTVPLGSDARPYNYSDMTGSVLLGTVPQGSWTVVHDSGMSGTPWGTVSWNSQEPAGTTITVRVRSAETEADLTGQPWVEVANGAEFTDVPDGRYLQIEARLASTEQGLSPILYDLTVTSRCGARPMLYIEPASATTTISDTVTVEVRIRDVTDLYGVQLYLSFDPDLVAVVDAIPGGDVNIAPGDFLQPGALVYTNFVDNDTGEIEYVQTREGTVPGVDGSGVLARITFHGQAAGISPVQFTLHKLSDPQSVPIDHDYADGEIIVEGLGSVSGRVILERRVNYPNANAGATVELAGQSQVTGNDGHYSFSNVPAGTHQIKVTHPSYLPSWRNVDVTAGAATSVPDVELLGGDCNTPQGGIDGVDATTMGLAWDSEPGDAHWNARADVRDDSVIDVFDFTAVKFNWGHVAPGLWPGASASGGVEGRPMAEVASVANLTPATRLVISPTTSTVTAGGQTVIEVWVEDVANLYGAGFEMEFDPSAVHVRDADPFEDGVQIESGSWLKRQQEVINTVDHGYGRIEFFVTQSYPATAKSGSGILARITLEGMAAGDTVLHFNSVQLVDDTAQEIPATAEDGHIHIAVGYTLYLPVVLRNASTS